MQRHTKLLSTIAAAVFVTAACTSDAARDAVAQTGDNEASEIAPAASELSCVLSGATPEEAQDRPSPLRETRFSYDGGEGLLCYGAPSARGREIVGGLVPLGEPWRAGANEPTTVHLSGATSIGGVALEPGAYALYVIPGEDEWEFFLNSNTERWGIPIDDKVRSTEVGSFAVTPETTDEMVETLAYDYGNGAITMSWEHTRLRIPIGDM